MDRRQFLGRTVPCTFLLTGPASFRLDARLLPEHSPQEAPIPEPHFPTRLHTFIWRNWELANTERLAQVLKTTPEKVLDIGYSMGLPSKPLVSQDQLRRIFITVIRQNWHILPDRQLMQLLGWDREHYEFHLREDDFLWIKLGSLKPKCDELRYEPPSAEAKRCAAEIKELVRGVFGEAFQDAGEPPFQFVEELSAPGQGPLRISAAKPIEDEVDFTHGWTILRPDTGSRIPEHLIEGVCRYFRSSMAAEVRIGEENSRGMKVLRLSLDPANFQSKGAFEVNVQRQEVHLSGNDLAGLRQAIYFVQDRMEERGGPYLRTGSIRRGRRMDPRFSYAYFTMYGDPLMEEGIDPFPDGFLEKLARHGVNGVWLQAVLRTLAPSEAFPEFGAGSDTRIRKLAQLVDRAKRYGAKIYLYLNEPRAMPAEFFARHPDPDIKGAYDGSRPDFFAMCTSTLTVRNWLSQSVEHVFSRIPDLGGIFCITASENLTNCCSHGQAHLCPRCSRRPPAAVIAEVVQSFRDGVRRSGSSAEVIAWDWGWGKDWVANTGNSADIIQRLPSDVSLLSVSEWNKPVTRGGHSTKVGEYSISAVGPGPRAIQNWELAREKGLARLAKVQWNNSWEISAVPYVPVPFLIAEHCENLLKADVEGLLVSWTVGGYPSPNLDVARSFYFSPAPEPHSAVRDVAIRRYGAEAAPLIVDAWTSFSNAFREFPMEGGGVVYHIPTQHGPANLLRLHPTGYRAAMVLFPYDDYKAWVGSYPVEVAQRQFEKIARMWEPGLEKFRQALPMIPEQKRGSARRDMGIAETCYSHFRSVSNQIHFCRLRELWGSADPDGRQSIAREMARIADDEIQLAKRQFAIARSDSTISFEASNHYYYRPLDLAEKVVSCADLIARLKKLEPEH